MTDGIAQAAPGTGASAPVSREATIRVWDPIVRVFHWSLVASFAIAWLSADEWGALHHWAGYAAGSLIAFRLVYGLVGSRYARFTQFVRSPRTVIGFLNAMRRGDEPRYVGHNPAGGAMIVALILTVGAVATTGWMQTTDAFWGVEWVSEFHELLANLMMTLVVAHVAGVLLASYRHKENLILAMIKGRKRAPGAADIA